MGLQLERLVVATNANDILVSGARNLNLSTPGDRQHAAFSPSIGYSGGEQF